jgi:hypothetical protein
MLKNVGVRLIRLPYMINDFIWIRISNMKSSYRSSVDRSRINRRAGLSIRNSVSSHVSNKE